MFRRTHDDRNTQDNKSKGTDRDESIESISNEVIVAYQDLVDLKVIKKDFPLGKCKKAKVDQKAMEKEAEEVRQKLIAEFPDVIKALS